MSLQESPASTAGASPAAATHRLAEFCIFGSARTGSTHLTTSLDRSPDIVCHQEIFHNKRFNLPREYRKLLASPSVEERKKDPYRFLEELNRIDSGRHPAKRLLGFKVFPAHSDKLWKRLLKDPARAKVLIYRENKLAQYASLKMAREDGHWKKNGGRPPAPDGVEPRVMFDAEEFEKWRTRQDRFEAAFADDSVKETPIFRIEYRQINDAAKLGELLAFLGARQGEGVESGMRKQHGSDILARFENPQDAVAWMQGAGKTHWAAE